MKEVYDGSCAFPSESFAKYMMLKYCPGPPPPQLLGPRLALFEIVWWVVRDSKLLGKASIDEKLVVSFNGHEHIFIIDIPSLAVRLRKGVSITSRSCALEEPGSKEIRWRTS